MNLFSSKSLLAAALLAAGSVQLSAQLKITEVDSAGSSSSYAADWFELTNFSSSAISTFGYKMDDNSNLFANSVAMSTLTIGAGESVIFLETTNLATTQANFVNAWFNGSAPVGLQFGSYSGSGVGLSQSGDAVNIFNAAGTVLARVDFGVPTGTATFDNSAALNNVTLTQASVANTNHAFTSSAGEIGSPGLIPEPGTYAFLSGLAVLGFAALRRRVLAA